MRAGSSARSARSSRRRETTGGGVAVIEHLAPQGHGSPLHVHHNEDEWFYVIEGELTFWVGGEVIDGAGRLVRLRPARRPAHLPRQLTQARFLLVAEPAGFEGFMRAIVRAGRRTARSRRRPCNRPRPSR